MNLRLSLSPHGRLLCECDPHAAELDGRPEIEAAMAERLSAAFAKGSAEGLLMLAGPEVPDRLPPEFAFWRGWGRRLFEAVRQLDEDQLSAWETGAGDADDRLAPNSLELAVVVADAPPMHGLEYLSADVLRDQWLALAELVRSKAEKFKGGLPALLRSVVPEHPLLGRVTFHLAENRRDEARPFAFLATYAHRLSARAKLQHLPLAQALREYASQRDQAKLAELLAPVRMAADRCPQIAKWLQSRSLFHPQTLSIGEAHEFLRSVPLMEESGLAVRVPNWWQARKPPRPSVEVRLGDREPSTVGAEGLLDFSIHLALDGEELTEAERKELLRAGSGLMKLRGKWVEVDRERLDQALAHWEALRRGHAKGIDFLHGMRLLAGASLDEEDAAAEQTAAWSQIVAGDWLRDALSRLRDPSGVAGCRPGEGLRATLRPYQADGVRWLWFMTGLRLGACLADDMGLGKTIQVIDLLLRLRDQPRRSAPPSLLIVPASLLGNWRQELDRFAPQLRAVFAHRSECDLATLERIAARPQEALAGLDLVVTTYSAVRKADWPGAMSWRLVVLDEAQAIKNSGSAQTKATKKLAAECRIVLTGTPVENQLGDLWSLFDFCSPGLLGSAKKFKEFIKRMQKEQDVRGYGALRKLVQPYILRRLKTDPQIVPDLPEKTEMRVECSLSKRQAVLYQEAVEELEKELAKARIDDGAEEMRRRGIVLSTMMRLKQICNHPAQFLGEAEFPPDQSGKFAQLTGIAETIAQRQEKVLVFTQFQSLCQPLADHLAKVFRRPGLVLHGGVAVGKRKELVRRFQEEESISFFVVSVKAGGTGLNLTAASHVVHFDRWWNPAVENQATDRAFRIGQKRNVLVHKFVCRGTLEERIDRMIHDKQRLADEILGPSREGETMLTELSDAELLRFVALDIDRAAEEL